MNTNENDLGFKLLRGQEKVISFFKNNLDNIIVLAICIIYVLYGAFNIEETNKTIGSIIATGSLSAIVGFSIKTIRTKGGILAGLNSPKFLAKTNLYGQTKENVSDCIEEIPNYCIYKNKRNLLEKQKEYLSLHAMSYDLFSKGIYDKQVKELISQNKKEEAKELKLILKKCRSIKVFQLEPTLLTNAYDNSCRDEVIMQHSIKGFEKKKISGDFFISLIFIVIFGCFSLGIGKFNLSNIIWTSLQIALYLILGQIKYADAYRFVTEDLRGKIDKVISLLEEFQNLRRKVPGIFAVEYKIDIDEERMVKDNGIHGFSESSNQ